MRYTPTVFERSTHFEMLPNAAVRYTKRAGSRAWQANTDSLGYRAMAAGGGFTTVDDLLRFASALTGHRLLSAENTRLLTTGKVKSGGGPSLHAGLPEVTSPWRRDEPALPDARHQRQV